MVLYRLRRLSSGWIAGAWVEFGGFWAQLRPLSTHLEAFFRNNMDVMAPGAGEEGDLLARMVRSKTRP